jgi:DNA-binding CsgD family transcriptional regulator
VVGAFPLVGRRTELALVTQALVGGTGPHVVVVIGEAGVGKTRLLAEAIRSARAVGVTVLAGNCLPLTETVPFLPLSEALRALGSVDGKAAVPAVLARCAPHVRSELARLIPDWAASPASAQQAPIHGWEQGRLFAAMRDLLAALTAERSCALVIEDVHWADATTLDFLSYLTAVDRDGATRVMLSCREEELDPKHPVGQWLAEVARQVGVTQLTLDRLSQPEVAEQVRGLLRAAVPPSFVDVVFARAGGNAFFTEQLVAASVSDQGRLEPMAGLPASLAQLLIARVETVGDDGRQVLTALAVAGRGLDEELLLAITGLSLPRLGTAVRDLADARLIDRPPSDGRYQLRHALVGEAIAADLLAGERREQHAVIAQTLIAHDAADGAGEVAEHWAAAGRMSEELRWRLAAATEAGQVYAHREAATHWERVIDLWSQVPAEVRPAGLDLATVYLNALRALDRCGDTKRAGWLAEQAAGVHALTADRRTQALLYERVGTYRELDEDGAGLEALDFAMDRLADLPVGPEHAVVLLTYGQALWELGRVEEARPYLERAQDACQSEVPQTDDLSVLCLLAWPFFDSGDIATGMRLLDQVAALLSPGNDHPAGPWVACERSQALLVLGHLEDAAAVARSGLEIAHRCGLEQTAAAQHLRCDLFEALAELGRHAEAETVIRAATQWAPVSGASYDQMTRATLDMLVGDLDAATKRWAAIEAVTHPKNLEYGGNLVDRGVIDLWAQRPHATLSRIKRTSRRWDDLSYRPFTAAILSTAMRACADLAETARARRERAGEHTARMSAQDLVDVHDAMRRDPFAAHSFYVTATAHGATWAAELTRVAGTSDPDAWATAAAAWNDLHRPHRAAYARWRQAEAVLTAGHGSEAGDCLRDAAAAAHNYAPLLSEIRSLATLARLDLRDKHFDSGPSETAQPLPYGLTPREAAVLRLVADGLTNTQIGNRLFISNKTASVHVTHILNKLGVRNRTQAAAQAQRAGLLGAERDRNLQ